MISSTVFVTGLYTIYFIICYWIVVKKMYISRYLAPALSLILISFMFYVLNLFILNPVVILIVSLIIIFILGNLLGDPINASKEKVSFKFYLVTLLLMVIVTLPRLIYLKCFLSNSPCAYIFSMDEDKHLTVLTSIVTSKNYMPFVYKPDESFTYYYFYYLFPGVLMRLTDNIQKGPIWALHVAVSYGALILSFQYLLLKITSNRALRLWGLSFIIFGASFKLVPKLMSSINLQSNHIEWWYLPDNYNVHSMMSKIGWQVSHPITGLLWVPQHEFAILCAIILISLFLFFKQNLKIAILQSIVMTAMFGSSIFISIIVLGVNALTILRKINNPRLFRIKILVFFIFLVLILPFVLQIHNNQAHLVFAPYLPIIDNNNSVTSVLYFYLIETGISIPLLVIFYYFYFLSGKNNKNKDLLFILTAICVSSLVVSRLFQTAHFNDIGMRTSMLFTVCIPLLLCLLINTTPVLKKNLHIIILITMVPIVMSAGAGVLEIFYRLNSTYLIPQNTARLYADIASHTKKDQIIVSNNSQIGFYMPIVLNRLSISDNYGQLEVYIPKPKGYGIINSLNYICSIYNHISYLHYRFVYAEIQGESRLDCGTDFKIKKMLYATSRLKIFEISKY